MGEIALGVVAERAAQLAGMDGGPGLQPADAAGVGHVGLAGPAGLRTVEPVADGLAGGVRQSA